MTVFNDSIFQYNYPSSFLMLILDKKYSKGKWHTSIRMPFLVPIYCFEPRNGSV